MDRRDPAFFLNGTSPGPPRIDLRRLLRYNELTCTIWAFILNFLLCYLIIRKTPIKLSPYKPVLLQNCLLDILYSITNLLTESQVEFKEGNLFVLLNGPFQFMAYPWSTLMLGMWHVSLFLCVTGVPIQFLLRYNIVVKGQQLTRKKHFFLLGISTFLSVTYTAVVLVVHWPYPEVVAHKSYLLARDSYYHEGIPSYFIAEVSRLQTQLCYAYCYFILGGSYGVVIYTSIKVYKHIKGKSNLPSRVRDVHKQITTTLMVQAVAPIVVCVTPIGLCVMGSVLYVDIPGAGLLLTLLWSLIPLVNSIITLTAIRTYRNTISQYLDSLRNAITCTKSTPTVAVINTDLLNTSSNHCKNSASLPMASRLSIRPYTSGN